jgi:hypothetical protein
MKTKIEVKVWGEDVVTFFESEEEENEITDSINGMGIECFSKAFIDTIEEAVRVKRYEEYVAYKEAQADADYEEMKLGE